MRLHSGKMHITGIVYPSFLHGISKSLPFFLAKIWGLSLIISLLESLKEKMLKLLLILLGKLKGFYAINLMLSPKVVGFFMGISSRYLRKQYSLPID